MRDSLSLERGVMSDGDRVAVIIVGFRNAGDVCECITALSRCNQKNFDVFVCENGGDEAFRTLCETFDRNGSFLDNGHSQSSFLSSQVSAENKFSRVASYRLRDTGVLTVVGEAAENLGYAGGINSWLRLLLEQPYAGFWILNPDTLAEPDALTEMVKYARASGKGMVGSRIVAANDPFLVQSRGLRWRPVRASTEAVDINAPASLVPDIKKLENLLDAPSGASFYVTRECVEQIGLMDERYFLYFEDLDWGMRAKEKCGLGYAYLAVVRHQGGTTIGPTRKRAEQTALTVYLEFRNRVLFVKRRYPAWYPWTVFVLTLRALEYSIAGSLGNTKMAFRGIAAGVVGQIGRPDDLLERHVFVRAP
jgi:N-acetylglucosaminyl-diphospho-decaprenol L-rhamnosyltransferase